MMNTVVIKKFNDNEFLNCSWFVSGFPSIVGKNKRIKINASMFIKDNHMLTAGKLYSKPRYVLIDRPNMVPADMPKITLFVFFGEISDTVVNAILITEEYTNAGINLNIKAI